MRGNNSLGVISGEGGHQFRGKKFTVNKACTRTDGAIYLRPKEPGVFRSKTTTQHAVMPIEPYPDPSLDPPGVPRASLALPNRTKIRVS